MQKEKGKKAMLIKVNNITFWPNLVAARLSITLLALNSLPFISWNVNLTLSSCVHYLLRFEVLLLPQVLC
jgi:hypothetical protein